MKEKKLRKRRQQLERQMAQMVYELMGRARGVANSLEQHFDESRRTLQQVQRILATHPSLAENNNPTVRDAEPTIGSDTEPSPAAVEAGVREAVNAANTTVASLRRPLGRPAPEKGRDVVAQGSRETVTDLVLKALPPGHDALVLPPGESLYVVAVVHDKDEVDTYLVQADVPTVANWDDFDLAALLAERVGKEVNGLDDCVIVNGPYGILNVQRPAEPPSKRPSKAAASAK